MFLKGIRVVVDVTVGYKFIDIVVPECVFLVEIRDSRGLGSSRHREQGRI